MFGFGLACLSMGLVDSLATTAVLPTLIYTAVDLRALSGPRSGYGRFRVAFRTIPGVGVVLVMFWSICQQTLPDGPLVDSPAGPGVLELCHRRLTGNVRSLLYFFRVKYRISLRRCQLREQLCFDYLGTFTRHSIRVCKGWCLELSDSHYV